MLTPYIDVHTHYPVASDAITAIVNKYEAFEQGPGAGYCSMGLHPWYLNDLTAQMRSLKQYSRQAGVLAIGECGLDTLCATPPALQEQAFGEQIAWANESGKPLIIHCVRAYSKALSMLKAATVPVVFHGFSKKQQQAREILDKGHYLSFGTALLREKSLLPAVLAEVPADRFFLETDTGTTAITEVYRAAAVIRKTEMDTLILQLQQNFKKVFGI